MNPSEIRKNVTGLVLAGGEGKRMSGEDKGLMDWIDQPIIQLILDKLNTTFDHIIINANRHIDIYQRFGFPVVKDEIGDFAGPLAGIHAGLKSIVTPYTFVVPCDLPNFNIEVALELIEQVTETNSELAVSSVHGRLEPAVLLLKTNMADSIEAFLRSGKRKTADWVTAQKYIEVDFSDAEHWFANINTPADRMLYAKLK
jgi:molybdenum cofactor guanylyltransferase